MAAKTCNVTISISMLLTLTVAALSIFGVLNTDFYPEIIVLLLVALIPLLLSFTLKKSINKSDDF